MLYNMSSVISTHSFLVKGNRNARRCVRMSFFGVVIFYSSSESGIVISNLDQFINNEDVNNMEVGSVVNAV